MRSHFDSAAMFLKHVQAEYSRPVQFDRSDKGFDRMTKEALRQHGATISDDNFFEFKFEPVMDDLTSTLMSALSPSELLKTRQLLAIGALESNEFNAMCIRSQDGWYAIVINYGLFMYLNMYFKLQAAFTNPKAVVYCNPGKVENLVSADYKRYFEHLVEQYQRYGAACGPKIKLNEGSTFTCGLQLLSAELFVLGHELGHFLNGDLEDEANLEPHPKLRDVRILVQDRDREIENQADITGYRLLKEGLKTRFPKIQHTELDNYVFGLVMNVMDALYFVTSDQGNSHPTSIERMVSIARHYYGERIAELVSRSFKDQAIMTQLFGELRLTK